MKKEPVRHHYIPQFILRNFAFDNVGKVFYYDKSKNTISEEEPRNIYFSRNLYRDEINSASDPTQIEHDFAVFESEVSKLIKERFLTERDIYLSIEDDSKLKLFFALMGLRSRRTSEYFKNIVDKSSQKFYKPFQLNEDFEDFWKRNLGMAVKCRSLQEILEHPLIDPPMKLFIQRDTEYIAGAYFVVVSCKSPDCFIIGDSYPVVISGETPWGVQLTMYSIYPISPTRAVLIASNGVEGTPREVSNLHESVLLKPSYNSETQTIKIRVKTLFPEEVHYLNTEILKNSSEGFVFNQLPQKLLEAKN